MPTLRLWLASATVVAASLLSQDASAEPTKPAKRTVVNRVVASVDREPITWFELMRRATPLLPQVEQVPEADREKAREQLMRQLLDKLIAERLIAMRAQELGLTIFDDAVDRALESIAQRVKRTVPEVLGELRKIGYSEAEYREEIRLQLLEVRVLSQDVGPKVRLEGLSEKDFEEKFVRAKVDFLNALASQHSIEDRL